MRIVGVDVETFYDTASKYSLSSMGSEAYIRDARFQEIGWAAQVRSGDGPWAAPWYDGRRPAGMHEWLLSLELDKPGTVVVAHNGIAFDFLVLAWKHGIHPWRAVDTLAMARWKWGKFGPDGKGNSLKALAEHFDVGAKGEEVILANGKRLSDFTAVELMQYGRYCSNDVQLTLDIFERMAPDFLPADFTTMHLTAAMSFDARIILDRPVLEEGLAQEKERKATLLEDMAQSIGTSPDKIKSAVMSNPKFAMMLEAIGYEPPMKESKTTGKMTFAFAKTDPEMQEWADSDDEILANLVRLRTGIKSTIMESRLQRFLDMEERGPSPAGMRCLNTVTGRLNADGGIHKLQKHNIPKRANARNALRVSMGAGPGKQWYAADSGQIEVRVLAELAGEEVLRSKFQQQGRARDKELAARFSGDLVTAAKWKAKVEAADLYLGLGPTIFGRPITKADKFERGVNKAAILAGGFGQGWRGFKAHCRRNGIDLTDDLSEVTINAYRGEHPAVVALWKQCRRAVQALAGEISPVTFGAGDNMEARAGELELPSGRVLLYPKCASRYDEKRDETVYTYQDRFTGKWKYLWHGIVVENAVQSTAYDVLAWQAAQILKEEGHALTLFVHDELAYIDDEDKEDYWERVLTHYMREAPPWLPDIALDCEFGHGPTYADV